MTALDKTKFAKVRALMEAGATQGERAAGRKKAEAMASKAGLSLDAAIAVTDGKSYPATPMTPAEAVAKSFNDFFNTPEMIAERAERENKRLDRCADLLTVYGSQEAVFAETERETALRLACTPIADWKSWFDDDGVDRPYANSLAGWDGGWKSMPDAVREAVTCVWPMPTTVAGIWQEFIDADRLTTNRCQFVPGHEPEVWVRAREYVLENALDTVAATSIDDIRARFDWMDYLHDRGFSRDVQEDQNLAARLRADVEEHHSRAVKMGEAALRVIDDFGSTILDAELKAENEIQDAMRAAGFEGEIA